MSQAEQSIRTWAVDPIRFYWVSFHSILITSIILLVTYINIYIYILINRIYFQISIQAFTMFERLCVHFICNLQTEYWMRMSIMMMMMMMMMMMTMTM